MKTGCLYLIPVPIGDAAHGNFLSPFHSQLLNELNHYVVEDEKTARRFLRAAGMKRPFEEIQMSVLNEHTSAGQVSQFLLPTLNGQDIGLMSDAGCPAVADPGSGLVRIAHEKNIRVIPLSGPSSILLALMASGLNGQNFRFQGYLPRERKDRIAAIRQMESIVARTGETQIFMDTPYRNMNVLEDLLKECKPETLLCIAANVHGSSEFIKTKSVAQWRINAPDLAKKPAMFLIGR